MKLTEKQKRFVDYYIETGNQTESARQAGYKQPQVQGAQNLEKLREIINKRISEKDHDRIAKQDEILEFLTAVMRGEVVESVPLGVGMGKQVLVDNTPSLSVRKASAELLGKRYSMWIDRQQVDITGDVQIVDDIPRVNDDD